MLYAASLGVSDEVWSITLAWCFLSLHAKYERWLGITQSIMGPWLSEAEPETEAEVA